MQKILSNSLYAGAAVLAMAIAAPLVVNAETAPSQESPAPTGQRPHAPGEQQRVQAQEQSATAQTQAAEARENAKTKLTEAKLKACQARTKAITTIMKRHNDRGARILEVFTTISERTQAFYAERGTTLSNYDELVANVDAKKAAAEAALSHTQESSSAFSCEGDDPKGAANAFKDGLKARNEALKAYKSAIKDLIAGVKSAQGTTSSTEAQNNEGGQQ